MFQKFYELFNALNQEALETAEEDLSTIEDAQRELVNAWTDYMMSRDYPPDDEEMEMYTKCVNIVERF